VAPSGGEPSFQLCGKAVSAIGDADQRPEHAHHVEDFRNGALVEGMNGDALPDQRGDDVRLEIGETEDEVRPQIEDLRNIRRGEG
jgi:hypothetical protein